MGGTSEFYGDGNIAISEATDPGKHAQVSSATSLPPVLNISIFQ